MDVDVPTGGFIKEGFVFVQIVAKSDTVPILLSHRLCVVQRDQSVAEAKRQMKTSCDCRLYKKKRK